MKNFNLLVSTSRYNEKNAMAELWFTFLIIGDEYPIILNLDYIGLFAALTSLNPRGFIEHVKEIIKKDQKFFQFILKIIPIDFVCETNLEIINNIVKEHAPKFIKADESFKIELQRRNSEDINRDEFIEIIAENLDNKVDLTDPDKIIRFEILGNICGISFLKQGEILSIESSRYESNQL
ncbi:MAG: THUMP domain-containing protein [Promethearchaeia archaeon]